jgi:CheY-like chemotaxis protein
VGKIEFGYKIKEKFIEFYVNDTGIGIDPEHHKLIFNRFRQEETEDPCKYGGNGLGLSISKALVEKLGGTISVNSELGKGSTFIFTIPYINGIKKDVNTLPHTNLSHTINWQNKTILIVEDDRYSHDYLKEIFSGMSVLVLHATNGNDAVELVNNHPEISLVLMDIKMPKMNGYEAMKIIKNIRPNLPIIAQTAHALYDDKSNALHAGFDDYITKPINKNLLIKLINRLLVD